LHLLGSTISDFRFPIPGLAMPDDSTQSALPPIAIPAFSGPLDLLLHLIRVNEVSITDIPIAEITEQYTAFLDAMQELDLDAASEYIALAAELIYIKSKMLLPRLPGEPEEDPRADLAQRLLDYEKFKRSAETLHAIDTLRGGLWPRPETEIPRSEGSEETLEVSLFDLIETFRHVTEQYRVAHPPALAIHHLRFSVREKMLELLGRLDETRTMPLLEFLGQMRYRAEAVTAFLACLELIRLGVVRAFQARPFAEIHASRTEIPFSADQIRDNYAE
jgi:segregation and condensation protein A